MARQIGPILAEPLATMRVILDVGDCPGCNGSNRVGLTADEARELAVVLVAQSAAVEGGT
jgi:hypothetical protein